MDDEKYNKRVRVAKYPELEECLIVWHQQTSNKNVPISDEMLIDKAKDYGVMLDIKDFNYSCGWLTKFKQRHGLSLQKIVGKSGSVDKQVAELERGKLNEVLRNYDLKVRFNLDETALFYRLGPNQTLASTKNKLEGIKLSKERCCCS